MRISRRTSGGRGEYEISENFGSITPKALFDRRIELDLGSGIVFDTGTILRLQGGKRRLRLAPDVDMQLHRQVAAVLLMPRPVRADGALGSGMPILRENLYAIEHIEIANVSLLGADRVHLTLGDLTLRNYNLHAEPLSLRHRVNEVVSLWQNANELPMEIAGLLQDHELSIRSGAPITEGAEKAVGAIQNAVIAESQNLGILYGRGGDDIIPPLLRALQDAVEPPAPPISVAEVAPEETDIRRRTVGQWKRWVAARGARSARFRRDVREAYNWTCVVCGVRLPATSFNLVAGVDGAHILPWAEYDLDVVANGLCLCKQHHWAFDQGLFVITCENGKYSVEVPEQALEDVVNEQPQFSIHSLTQFVGPIDEDRLPKKKGDRPNPQFLRRLYESEN